jgi:uncharacterized protein YggE
MGAAALKACVQIGTSSVPIHAFDPAGARRRQETIMKSFVRATALAGLLAGGALAAPIAAGAQTTTSDPVFAATTLSLSAHGETQVTPDQATITLGVQTKSASARDAMAQNAQRMSAVIAALRAAGIAGKDIRTSNISLEAQYVYAQNTAPRLTGYQASNDVTVTVEDLAKLGPAIDAVTEAGANQINAIGFGLKEPQPAEDAARLAAVKALRAKAELYAQAAGYHIVRLVNLSEGGGNAPQQFRPMEAMKTRSAAAATPVEAGELAVGADVSAVFELAR